MRTIHKLPEPPSWRRHRTLGGTYDNYTERDAARDKLLEEQGHLCCFCMRRISRRAMKIAHWDPQSTSTDRTMDWHNVMGACTGGDGVRGAILHCDTKQGATTLTVNPADEEQLCERTIRYDADGVIWSNVEEINKDLDKTLNLNNELLKPKRRQVLDILQSRLEKVADKSGYCTQEVLERELRLWQSRDKEGQFKEYCQVAIYYLEKKLSKRFSKTQTRR